MAENWAERQRRTNQLVRIAADYIFNKEVKPEQLYGLCKLTWITRSYDGENPAYVKSTKIPALSLVFQEDFSSKGIEQIAKEISRISNNKSVSQLIISQTGFSNSYNAFRNSSSGWVVENFDVLLALFKEAFHLTSDEQGLALIKKVAKLPSIPNPEDSDEYKEMHPEYLITPVLFALDGRIRFPIINGNKGVKNLLSKLKVTSAPLGVQYSKMISLYGIGGIIDAADLDQVDGQHLTDFIEIPGKKPSKKILENKPSTNETELPLKDESDIITLQESRTITSKRLHNVLTNKLRVYLADYTLLEGCNDSAMFDVLVNNYDGNKNDLLIEVKSSSETAHIRMAIGQVFDYWFRIKKESKPHHLAILLPNAPDEEIKKLLEWLEIGIFWFSGERLVTCCNRLDVLIKN